jgi:hypothetical protein
MYCSGHRKEREEEEERREGEDEKEEKKKKQAYIRRVIKHVFLDIWLAVHHSITVLLLPT